MAFASLVHHTPPFRPDQVGSLLKPKALSPQCGFSSTLEGNKITVAEEIAKLGLIVETAREIWGD
jgi:hypothetical protein